MKIVTGGAGFIGSNIVAALNAAGERPILVDRLESGNKWQNLSSTTLDDFCAPEDLFALLDARAGDIEAIIHMGAISSTTERDGDLIIANNFRLPCSLWKWCALHSVPFVYASSAAVYGDGALGFDDTEDPGHLARLRPLNAYGWSKLLFDRWVVAQIADGRPTPPKWAGLRFFNVYGPHEAHKGPQRSVATQCFERATAGESMRLFASDRPEIADGEQKRDFVWVGDCVDVVLAATRSLAKNGIYNVGSGVARSFNDLATGVFRALGHAPKIEYIAMPSLLQGKYQYSTCATMQKLHAAGYIKPATTLEDGIALYAEHWRDAIEAPTAG